MAGVVTVLGLPIPSASPLFLAGVAIHVAFGVTAVLAGAVAMTRRKQAGAHPRFGTLYFWSIFGLFTTSAALTVMRPAEDYPLALLGTAAFVAAVYGRQARRAARPGWSVRHLTGMGVSYVGMLTAFYVDNGPHLPVWRDLPPIALWLAPSVVGLPIIAWAAARHRRP